MANKQLTAAERAKLINEKFHKAPKGTGEALGKVYYGKPSTKSTDKKGKQNGPFLLLYK